MIRSKRLSLFSAWAITLVLLTPFCGLWFSCGCDWPWNGFFMGCDAITQHTPPPHCPWCVHRFSALLSIGTSLAGGTAVVIATWHPACNGFPRLHFPWIVATLVSLSLLFLCGWLTALATGHPTFLGFPLA